MEILWNDSGGFANKKMTKRPSFLERLTGMIEEDEQNNISVNSSDNNMEEEKEMPEKIKNNPKKSKKIFLPAETEMKETQQDWMPDSEGQLTIDVYQNASEIIIKSTIAGVSPEDLDITITNDMVTIKGKREKDEEIQTDDYYYQECYWGAFSRSVILPVDVEADKAQAGMKNGILTIRLPKIEKIKTRKIKVNG
ncbi:MAG: Protein containing Heat shock protein Hsp20 protein [Parcubacteria group bacterium GW2011_GWA1_42_7]|nr:MAG: Protein containing Heat shock protein Hsp20 protein [Parcubacteria group bacterium GW2011_GWB1_42_6]KKS68994.1 MAG: Protein containing Heat shock protein Hsp20 protein [Parcubacteria group bacterium GW2011_GWA1_42_7]KKS92352.1 MAG: Small heat shock protein [Parcubacteria group bacterium GW2011_GWC1_43_12]